MLEQTGVTPGEFIDAARTVFNDPKLKNWGVESAAGLEPDWIPTHTYLCWAREALARGGDSGLVEAVSNAKRAVNRLVDWILCRYHLGPLLSARMDEKVAALRTLGVEVPSIVGALIFDHRNDVEHKYTQPTDTSAKHAVELAHLIVRGIEEQGEPYVPVLFGLYPSRVFSEKRGGYCITSIAIDQIGVFVDIFDGADATRIIDFPVREVRSAPLADFTREQRMELAQLFRSRGGGGGGAGIEFYRLFKRAISLG